MLCQVLARESGLRAEAQRAGGQNEESQGTPIHASHYSKACEMDRAAFVARAAICSEGQRNSPAFSFETQP
jgi:hypothetical protein